MPSPTTSADPGPRGATNVFGIGLGRTGTTSLNNALIMLGYRAMHFPFDDATRREIADYVDSGAERIELTILREYDALTDIPVCCIYQGLDRAYPGSRFILTVRDKETWLNSCERLWTKLGEHMVRGDPEFVAVQYIGFLQRTLAQRTLAYAPPSTIDGVQTAIFDREIFAQTYDAYHREVYDYFRDRPADLLTLNIVGGEGWETLAPFLGLPIPEKPFPFEMRLRERGESEDSVLVAAGGSGGGMDTQARIDRVHAYVDAFRSHDLDSAMHCFADDAVLQFLDRRVSGQDDIAAWHRDRFKAGATVERVGAIETKADRVTVELVVGSKILKRWRVKLRGRAAFRLADDKIREMGLEDIRLAR